MGWSDNRAETSVVDERGRGEAADGGRRTTASTTGMRAMRACAATASAGMRRAVSPRRWGGTSGTSAVRAVSAMRARRASAVRSAGTEEGARGVEKSRLVFLGTPECAADVLGRVLDAAERADARFEVAAVVSQPGRPRGRGRKSAEPAPSPVAELAMKRGIAEDRILCPVKANEEWFLDALRALDVDLMVTAAYGNFLPQKFLDIPRYGTLNIHPSLLPQWRGAAPVQRALESGQAETGVSVAYTILKMDAGPVLRQIKRPLDGDEKAPEMLTELFEKGVEALLEELPSVFAGEAAARAVPQDEKTLSHAAKVSPDEGELDFQKQSALECHNKVRGFAGWPGTKAVLKIRANGEEDSKEVTLKIITTRVSTEGDASAAQGQVEVTKKVLRVPCGGGGWLELLEVQPPGKKAMPASAFINGLKGSTVFTV